jgi:hypothetical protein
MALAIADRIKELSNTTGSGPFHLTGATAGYKAVASALADGDQAYFGAFDGAGTWVIFLGTYNATPNTVTVTTVLSSSAGYSGFTTAPTVWIDSPAALLAKILPVMPANDNLVGVNLTQTLANKSFTPPVGIGTTAPQYSLDVYRSQSNPTLIQVTNPSPLAGSAVGVSVKNDQLNTLNMWLYGSNTTGSGAYQADGAIIVTNATKGISIGTGAAVSGVPPIRFMVNTVYYTSINQYGAIEFNGAGSGGVGLDATYVFGGVRNNDGPTAIYLANGATSGNNVQARLILATNQTSAAVGLLGNSYSNPTYPIYAANSFFIGSGYAIALITQAGYPIEFGINNGRAMRVAPDSSLQIGSATYSWTGVAGLWVNANISGALCARFDTASGACECLGNTTAFMWQFFWGNPNGTVGGVSTTGSTTAYATSSDYRLKDIVGPADTADALANVNAIKLYRGKFKGDDDDPRRIHVLAHEVQEVFPHTVVGKKDAMQAPRLGPFIDGVAKMPDGPVPDYQMIDFGQMGAPHLIAAIQELTKRLVALEKRTMH